MMTARTLKPPYVYTPGETLSTHGFVVAVTGPDIPLDELREADFQQVVPGAQISGTKAVYLGETTVEGAVVKAQDLHEPIPVDGTRDSVLVYLTRPDAGEAELESIKTVAAASQQILWDSEGKEIINTNPDALWVNSRGDLLQVGEGEGSLFYSGQRYAYGTDTARFAIWREIGSDGEVELQLPSTIAFQELDNITGELVAPSGTVIYPPYFCWLDIEGVELTVDVVTSEVADQQNRRTVRFSNARQAIEENPDLMDRMNADETGTQTWSATVQLGTWVTDDSMRQTTPVLFEKSFWLTYTVDTAGYEILNAASADVMPHAAEYELGTPLTLRLNHGRITWNWLPATWKYSIKDAEGKEVLVGSYVGETFDVKATLIQRSSEVSPTVRESMRTMEIKVWRPDIPDIIDGRTDGYADMLKLSLTGAIQTESEQFDFSITYIERGTSYVNGVESSDSNATLEVLPPADDSDFLGWAILPNDAPAYAPGDSIHLMHFNPHAILYAVYDNAGSNQYAVHYFTKGNRRVELLTADEDTCAVTLADAYATGFLGWATEQGGEVVYQAGDTVNLTADAPHPQPLCGAG